MIAQAGFFLLDVLTGFLSVALLLRFYMQACRVSFNNQLGTFVVDLTNWLVKPLRKACRASMDSIWRACCRRICCRLSLRSSRCSCCAAGIAKPGRRRPGCRCCFWQGLLATLRLSHLPADRCAAAAGRSVLGQPVFAPEPAGVAADPAGSAPDPARCRLGARSTCRR
jgi:hypothetical protein